MADNGPSGAQASAIARATTGASMLRGATWTSVAGLLPQVYALILSVAAARFLDPERLGRQSFIAFVSLSVVMVLTAGLSIALMRTVAETLGGAGGGRARGLVAWAWKWTLLLGTVGGIGLLVVAFSGAEPRGAWLFAAAGAAMAIVHAVPNAALLGAQRFREAAIVGLVTGTIGVPLIIGVLAAGGGITGVFAVEAVLIAVNLVWTAAVARRVLATIAPEPVDPGPLRRSTARYGAYMSLTTLLAFVVFRRSEFLFLAYYTSDTQIALYSIAFAAMSALAMLPERFGIMIMSAFAMLLGADARERIRLGYARSLRLIVILALPITAAAIVLAPALLRIIYGNEYAGAGPVLLVLLALVPILPAWHIANSLLTGMERVRAPLTATAIAAVVNVALAVVLVPRYEALGAAWANLIAQAVATIAIYMAARNVIGSVDWRPGSLLRAAMASAAVAGAAQATLTVVDGAPGVVLGSLAGCAAFVLVGTGLRILSSEDGTWLAAQLPARFGRHVRRFSARA